METHIASDNGNGKNQLPTPHGRRAIRKDYGVAAINYFSNCGVDRLVIWCRPQAEWVAARLNEIFFPGAEPELHPG
jgi:hypothetical protein